MKYKYGENKFFLGIVKFFDTNKDFGFIASNSCGMSPFFSDEDFYVNSGSFIETEAAKEGKIVVFQVEAQDKGRTRAVNVRFAKKTEEDIELSLRYYGKFEKIKFKEREINIFNKFPKPRSLELNMVYDIILASINRTPETTLKHFIFYINHYTCKDEAKERYIFDRDHERAQKDDWVSFFSKLTEEERIEIFRHYPSTFQYFNVDTNVLKDSICGLIQENANDPIYLSYIKSLIEYVPSGIKESVLHLFQGIIDSRIMMVLNEIKEDKSSWKQIEEENKYTHRDSRIDRAIWINRRVHPYRKLSSRNFEDEYNEVLYSIIKNRFFALFANFQTSINMKSVAGELKELFSSYDELSEFDKKENQDTLKEFIVTKFTTSANEGLFNQLVLIYRECERLGNDFSNRLISIASPFVREYFCERTFDYKRSILEDYFKQLNNCFVLVNENDKQKICEHCINHLSHTESLQSFAKFIENISSFGESFNEKLKDDFSNVLRNQLVSIANSSLASGYEFSQFFASYDRYKRYLNEEDSRLLVEDINKLIENSNISILSILSEHDEFTSVLPADYLTSRVETIISEWSYIDFSNCFSNPYKLFEKFPSLKEKVAQKGMDLIANFRINESFDINNKYFSSSGNCTYLKNIAKFIGYDFEPLLNYIESRDVDEKLTLFDNGVIKVLPTSISQQIVDEISVSDVLAPVERWYHRPKLENSLYNRILSSADNLFDLVEDRLNRVSPEEENIPLIVLLVELLSINKPKEDDNQWNTVFYNKLVSLSNRNSENSVLQISLWAVYLKTFNKNWPVRDVFPYLPPYLQIKLIKWFFYAKASNKLNFTARTLYNYVGGGNKKICFSVAIVLEYLLLRDDDPQATLTHNVMLRLLEDREDHSEWVGIREFVHDCSGRYVRCFNNSDRYQTYGNQQRRWRFFNGRVYKHDNGLMGIFVPRNMINEYGAAQNYNNRLYNQICQYIRIAFENVKEAPGNSQYNGTFFTIPAQYEIAVHSLVRVYNLVYGSIHDEIMKVELDSRENEVKNFCECRLADKPDGNSGFSFYWCDNRPCFRDPVRFHLNSEWENYKVLDFLRILGIPTDYTNKLGKVTRFGYYVILSSYLRSFAKFYEHLKCRQCGELMKPLDVNNFHARAVTEFTCHNRQCVNYNKVVYLNHCFNRNKCNATIDSRDSKTCPNGQYICPECGACCSTQNFARRLDNLKYNGGYISPWLENFVRSDLGHWEKNMFYCYKCGVQMQNGQCPICGLRYK